MIRLARPGETAQIQAIVCEAYRHYVPRIGREPGPMGDDYGRRIAEDQVWVLEDAGDVAGVLVLVAEADGCLLDNIAVPPDRQGRGFGRKLIAFAESEALRRGAASIRLYTHVKMTENIALYVRLGFVETGRASENGFDRVYMEKSLAAA